ncbi:protein-L-isoaspartate O-methyltransferase family protein [Marinivivus vitaminiproducens]|uniref:protein-L-isoaspartate O-methyltransferase family protein n=1 Tax=Marinivivus vitaminiproducens TaxID=3035935 RepID=UPI00279F0C4C|nr:protein-L-isoaspartate O-methyltransferase [Geminicoccaceae bacterium SCSIO 64248]
MTSFARARRNMIDNQLRPNQVLDPRVLEALDAVPREMFLPKAMRGVAYSDEDLALPDGRHLIEPLTFGRMLQAADIQPSDVVLVVGCDTGYGAAVVAQLAATVIALQADDTAAARVQAALDEQKVGTAVVAVEAEPVKGCPAQAPFDAILVLGSLGAVPPALGDQLSEMGRLAAVIRRGRVGKLSLWTKVDGTLGRRELAEAAIPALPEAHTEPGFAF